MIRIHKRGHHRKAYTRRDGTYVHAAHVASTTYTMQDRGAPGRGRKVIPPLKAGTLGVNFSMSEDVRRRQLERLAGRIGEKRVVSKLIALEVLNKRTNPELARKAKADAHYIAGAFRRRQKVGYPKGLSKGTAVTKDSMSIKLYGRPYGWLDAHEAAIVKREMIRQG